MVMYMVFQSDCLFTLTSCGREFHYCCSQCLHLDRLLILDGLICVKQNCMVLLAIFLISNKVEHVFLCLFICVTSFVNCLFSSKSHFSLVLVGFFVFVFNQNGFSYVLGTNLFFGCMCYKVSSLSLWFVFLPSLGIL